MSSRLEEEGWGEKAVEEIVGPQVLQAWPEVSPAVRRWGAGALPCAASYRDSVQLSRGPHTLPTTAGQSFQAP